MPDVVVRDGAPAPVALTEESVYESINKYKLAALRQKWEGLSDQEIVVALELASSLDLNPWTNEFYAAKGNQGLLMMVGRDGLLRKAEEFPDYLGYDCGVVYTNDYFERVDPDPDAKTMRLRAGVIHRPANPKDQGECLGAWAVAERRGRPPRYFFAPMKDYCPASPHPKSSWAKTPTIMIEKVPISVVHRTLCNLSGVYLEEEVGKLLEVENQAQPVDMEAMRGMIYELDVPIDVRDELWQGITDLNTLLPNSWGPATIQMKLAGRDEESIRRELRILNEDCERAAQARAGRAEPEPEVPDAEVVEETDPDAEPMGEGIGERPDPEPEEPVEDADLSEREERILELQATIAESDDPEEVDAAREQLDLLRGDAE
jgi:hypothetical protein